MFVGLALATLSLLFVGPEMKRLDASVSPFLQITGSIVIGGFYSAIGFVAATDIRWSSILTICVTVPSTPLCTLFWLMSGWSMPSFEAGMPLLLYVAGNVVLFLSALWVLIEIANTRAWRSAR
jgi:hypothetical protein